MRQVFLNSAEDMQWLRDVHWPTLPREYNSAVLEGNEDSPTRIVAYKRRDPRISDIGRVWLGYDRHDRRTDQSGG